MDKKESMEIMRTWPRMTKEDVKSADALFTHYLFFNAAGEVTASCCGKSGMVKSQALGRHREPGVCPFCGSKAVWYGKRFGKKYLAQYVPVMFIHKRNGTVYLRTCRMKRRYEDTLTPQTFYLATFSYRLRPGCAEMWENHCYYNRYHEEPKVDEYAYHLTDWMKKRYAPLKDVTGCVSYYVIGWDRLKGTFLQYVGAGDRRFKDGTYYDLTKRLMLACYYPIEMLEKLGLSCFVRDLMYGTVNKEIIDYTQKDPRRALGLNGAELKELQKYNDKVLLLRLRKRLLKRGYAESIESCADYLLLCNNDINRLVRMVDKLGESPGKIRRYLAGQVNQCGHMAYGGFPSRLSAWQHYVDYLNFCGDLELDVKDRLVAFPKDLCKAHDEKAKLAAAVQHERLLRQNAALLEERKQQMAARMDKYRFAYGGFVILFPLLEAEIVEEGKVLRHCVGGYAEWHISGSTTILFLRRAESPDTPLVTIEMNGNRIVQVHGYRNEREPCTDNPKMIPARELYTDVLEVWLRWLKKGSPRDKDGNPKIPKQKEVKTA